MRRAIITLDLVEARHQGEERHPQVIMRLLAHKHEFTITRHESKILDGRELFEVDLTTKELPTLPSYCQARFRR